MKISRSASSAQEECGLPDHILANDIRRTREQRTVDDRQDIKESNHMIVFVHFESRSSFIDDPTENARVRRRRRSFLRVCSVKVSYSVCSLVAEVYKALCHLLSCCIAHLTDLEQATRTPLPPFLPFSHGIKVGLAVSFSPSSIFTRSSGRCSCVNGQLQARTLLR